MGAQVGFLGDRRAILFADNTRLQVRHGVSRAWILQAAENAFSVFFKVRSALETHFVFPVEARVTALKLSDFQSFQFLARTHRLFQKFLQSLDSPDP